MLHLKSRENAEVKKVAALALAKERAAQKKYVVEGERAIREHVLAKSPIDTLYVDEEFLEAAQQLVPVSRIVIVTTPVLQKMSGLATPSGMLAVVDIVNAPLKAINAQTLILAQVSDPGNMGTLIRTATAMGITAIVVVEGCDPWAPKVVQASAGTIARVAITRTSWDRMLEIKKNTDLCALTVTGGKSPQELSKNPMALVIGNEAHGLPEEWQAACAERMTLPMPGGTESLNAAVAGSIALYLSHVR